MLRRVCTGTLLVGICLVTAIAFLTSSTARADMGVFPMRPDVSVYEPGQKAIIAWNDGKEIMILSTDANASEATKALRVLPLPSEPKIQTGSFSSFEIIQRLIDAYYPRPRPGWPWGESLGGAPLPPAVEILFHEQIGAHDITVAKANDYAGFLEWARDFVGEAGFSLPSQAEPVIEQYIDDDVRYFVFDIVEITEQESSIEPIVYEFETPVLYYPLVISTLIPGETKIMLFIITAPELIPVGSWVLKERPWLEELHIALPLPLSYSFVRLRVQPGELERIDPRIAGLFRGSAQLMVVEYEGPLERLNRDLELLLPRSRMAADLSGWFVESYPSNVMQGESVSLEAEIYNLGDKASGPFEIGLYLDGRRFHQEKIDGLVPWECVKIFRELDTSGWALGGHRIFIFVDTHNSIPEWNESNNFAASSPWIDLPDLAWDYAYVDHGYASPNEPQVGDRLWIECEVENRRSIDSPAGLKIEMELWHKGELVWQKIDGFILSKSIPAWRSMLFHIGPYYKFEEPGEYRIKLAIDPDDKAPESDETNNVIEWNFKVEP